MVMYYISIGLAILGTTLYHLFQKSTATNVHPILAVMVTYATALVLSLALLTFAFPLKDSLAVELRKVNWSSFALAFAIVGLEVGFLLVYRAGWNLSTAVIITNVAGALLLMPIGLLIFRERFTPVNVIGIFICIAGFILVNWKQ